MTNKTSSFLAGFALLTALFSTGSYVNIIDDDDDDETEATSTQLHITTRGSSANDTLSYPITLYAFNAASKLQASATLNSSTDNSVLALPNGSYRLVALAGTSREAKKVVTVACTKQSDGSWTVPAFCTLPGSDNTLTLSIALTTGSSITKTYGYTYNGMLKADIPYSLVGNYENRFNVDGNITTGEWGTAENISFNFGENTGGSGSGSEGGGSGRRRRPNPPGRVLPRNLGVHQNRHRRPRVRLRHRAPLLPPLPEGIQPVTRRLSQRSEGNG